jgi:hypothetical protein
VNVNNPEDKLDFDIYTSVEKVTNLSINGDIFTVYEPTDNIDKYFYKSFNGDKDYIWHCVDLFLDFVTLFRKFMMILAMNEKVSTTRRGKTGS